MWKNVQINIQNIVHETGRATLFKCPKKSKYNGLMFWHPSKLVREGSHSYAVKVSYTEDWNFKLFSKDKRGNTTYEIEISVEDFEECFGVMSKNITQYDDMYDEAFLNVKEPSKVDDVDVEIDECLLNK